MDVQYDRSTRRYYDNVTGLDLTPTELAEHRESRRSWTNPDGTSNDRP